LRVGDGQAHPAYTIAAVLKTTMSDIDELPVGPVPEDQVRVGDAERHQAAMALGDHFATGRLDQQEFDDRVRTAYGARTRRDLRRLFLGLTVSRGLSFG
jgi:hypothetical protein